MESGKLRGMVPITTHCGLPDMLSISYEAHFRVELFQSCTMAGYRHSYSKDALKNRALFFKDLLPTVKEDRELNAAKAWEAREASLTAEGIFLAAAADEDANEHGGVDFDDDLY
jgi:hypothetical protein